MDEETKKIFDSLKGGLPNIADHNKGMRPYKAPNTNFDFDHPPTQVHDDISVAETVAPVIPKGTPIEHHAKPIEPTHFDLHKGGEHNAVEMGKGHHYAEPMEAKTRIFQNYEAQVWQPEEQHSEPSEEESNFFRVRKPAGEVITPSSPPSIPSSAWRENVNVFNHVGDNRFKTPAEVKSDFFPERKPKP